MKSKPLNDYTRAELETALANYLNTKVHQVARCKWCGTPFEKNRRWQEFCSKNHQTLWHAKIKDRVIEEQQNKIAALERNVAELREELGKLHRRPD